MRRERLPPTALASWAALNHVEYHGVHIHHMGDNQGFGAVAQCAGAVKEGQALMTIPADLILIAETVHSAAKADPHLQRLLSAVGDFAQVAGLLQITTDPC